MALAASFGVVKAVQASEQVEPLQFQIDAAVIATRCGILASAAELDQGIRKAYLVQAQGFQNIAEVAYTAGYTMGVLDASTKGGTIQSYKESAKYFYQFLECKPNGKAI